MTQILKDMEDRLDGALATQAVLQHFAMALFEVIGDKCRVITLIEETTDASQAGSLYSGMSDGFLEEFSAQSQKLVTLLKKIEADSTPAQAPT